MYVRSSVGRTFTAGGISVERGRPDEEDEDELKMDVVPKLGSRTSILRRCLDCDAERAGDLGFPRTRLLRLAGEP